MLNARTGLYHQREAGRFCWGCGFVAVSGDCVRVGGVRHRRRRRGRWRACRRRPGFPGWATGGSWQRPGATAAAGTTTTPSVDGNHRDGAAGSECGAGGPSSPTSCSPYRTTLLHPSLNPTINSIENQPEISWRDPHQEESSRSTDWLMTAARAFHEGGTAFWVPAPPVPLPPLLRCCSSRSGSPPDRVDWPWLASARASWSAAWPSVALRRHRSPPLTCAAGADASTPSIPSASTSNIPANLPGPSETKTKSKKFKFRNSFPFSSGNQLDSQQTPTDSNNCY